MKLIRGKSKWARCTTQEKEKWPNNRYHSVTPHISRDSAQVNSLPPTYFLCPPNPPIYSSSSFRKNRSIQVHFSSTPTPSPSSMMRFFWRIDLYSYVPSQRRLIFRNGTIHLKVAVVHSEKRRETT